MSKAIISEELLTDIADELRDKYESTDTYTPTQMADAVSGLTKVSGSITINVNGSIDVTRYASANVDVPSEAPTLQDKTVNITPTTTAQSQTVSADSGYDGLDEVTINTAAVPTGTEGTPTATKGAVSNHAVTVTPSVTNTAGYISGGTKTGTAVSVSASELVSGSETKTANGTYDVTNLSEVVVDVPTPPSVEVEPLSVTDNGTYTAPSGKAYSPVTVNVSGGGGGSAEPNDVEYIDYDGTIVYSYSAAEYAQLTAHPANPSHDGLVAQGWNWTLTDAQAYVAEYGGLVIGQMYITESGDTEIDVEMPEGRLSPGMSIAVSGSVTVDWGDGTTPDTVTGTSLTTRKTVPHTYASAGSYTIKIHSVSGSYTFIGSYIYTILMKNGNANENRVYANCVIEVRLGAGITKLATYAFFNCASMTALSVPMSIVEIASSALSGCCSLKGVTLPVGVTTATGYVMQSCRCLERVSLPSGVTSVGNSAFTNCPLLKVYLPNGLTSIGDSAFSNCNSLRHVSVPNSVRTLSSTAFGSCFALTEISISEGLLSIPSSAFMNCYSLARITVPAGMASIGASAFNSCCGVREYHFLSTTPPSLGSRVFNGIPSDCKIYVPAESLEAYKTASGWSDYASMMVGE